MNAIVRRKLTTLKIGESVDLRPDGIPYSVERHAVAVYRIIPHFPEGEYKRIRCRTPETCIQKFAEAFGIEVES